MSDEQKLLPHKCDGEHGGPPCGPGCWNNEPHRAPDQSADQAAMRQQEADLLAALAAQSPRIQSYVHACKAAMIRDCQTAASKFPEGVGQMAFALMFIDAGLGRMTLPHAAYR